jgi:hypothetical protein
MSWERFTLPAGRDAFVNPDECDCGAGAPCVCNTHADFIAGEMPDNPPDVTGIMKSVIRVSGKKVN